VGAIFENADACFAPVLSLAEAMANEHLESRETYVMHDGLQQVSPAPRFSRTPGAIRESRSGRRGTCPVGCSHWKRGMMILNDTTRSTTRAEPVTDREVNLVDQDAVHPQCFLRDV
jgi:hypothetical protein